MSQQGDAQHYGGAAAPIGQQQQQPMQPQQLEQPPQDQQQQYPYQQPPISSSRGGRSRRMYATQQYDFNATQSQPQVTAYPPQMGQNQDGGMQQQQQQQQQQQPQYYGSIPGQASSPYGAAPRQMQQSQQPQYFMPAGPSSSPQIAQGGYQAPANVHQPATDSQGLVGGMMNQFSQLGFGNQQQQQAMAQSGPNLILNPLQPVDLMSQAVDPAELQALPPSIILPPNASLTGSVSSNCPPAYMRSTLNAVPTNNSLLKKSKIPFALIVRPYISLKDEENPVPVVGDTIIGRCRRCRTYINPFAQFMDNGHRWRCNMCNLANDVPQAYDWDAAAHEQKDRMQRPELNYSVVDFIAPTEYMVRPPQPLVYLFLIDVSLPAVTSGTPTLFTYMFTDISRSCGNSYAYNLGITGQYSQ